MIIKSKLLSPVSCCILLFLIFLSGAVSADVSVFDYRSSTEKVGIFYLNDSGQLLPVPMRDNPDAGRILSLVPAKDFIAWTDQLHIADFRSGTKGVVAGINGALPKVIFFENGLPIFPEIKSGNETSFMRQAEYRCLGSLLGSGSDILFHFFGDDIFSDNAGVRKPSAQLVRYSAAGSGADRFEFIDIAVNGMDEGWEPVEIIRTSEGFFIAWKYSDEKKTLFRYLQHDNEGKAINEIDESYFRAKYNPVDIESTPFALRGFRRAAGEGLLGDEIRDAGIIYLNMNSESAGLSGLEDHLSPVTVISRSDDGRNAYRSPLVLEACYAEGRWNILYSNKIIVCGDELRIIKLPVLPEDFRYTGIWSDGSNYLLSWEEFRFPEIGRAGLISLAFGDIF